MDLMMYRGFDAMILHVFAQKTADLSMRWEHEYANVLLDSEK